MSRTAVGESTTTTGSNYGGTMQARLSPTPVTSTEHDSDETRAVPGYVTTTVAGARLGVSGETVRRMVRRGELVGVRPTRSTVLVSVASLDGLTGNTA